MIFSACWIVKNEAAHIKKSILSVKGCCDELIVVDTGSVDDTIRIAKECGARVMHFEWINDFSAAKNYALSLAAGDYVIFLDGDEFFDPPLTKESGEEFDDFFRRSDADALRIPRYEIDTKDNSLKGVNGFDRIFRKGAIHYENKVHEVPRRAGGAEPRIVVMDSYRIVHTGYSADVIEGKAARNIAILEGERNSLTDPLALCMNTAHLMHEYMTRRDFGSACECCKDLLRHHQYQQEACARYHKEYIHWFYHAIHVVSMVPYLFNRQEVYEKLFCGIKENYPGTREAALADLHYQLKFHYREERFLREIVETEPRLEELPLSDIKECLQAESEIFEQAAEAAHMRRDPERTLHWAKHALRHSQTLNSRPLQMMFYWLRGKPPADFAVLIDELVDMENTDTAAMVMMILDAEEYRDAYELLLKRGVPKAPQEKPQGIGMGVKGAEGPDRGEAFRLRAERHSARMRYGNIAQDPDGSAAAAASMTCALHVAHANLMLGQYEKAYQVMLPYLGTLHPDLLQRLLVIAEMAEGDLAAKARKRYEEGQGMLDEWKNLGDVVNTGEVYGADAKKERRKIKTMTPKAFLNAHEKDKTRPVTDDLLEAHKRAAPVFEQHGCTFRAASSYRLLLAKGCQVEDNARHLRRIFRECGNEALAAEAVLSEVYGKSTAMKSDHMVISMPRIVPKEDTLKKLLADQCSMSRLGDGEFKIILGGGMGFQGYSKDLADRLKQILLAEDEGILICIPDVFRQRDDFEIRARQHWERIIKGAGTKICSYLQKDKVYYDAHVTRNYIDLKDKSKCADSFDNMKQLWDQKDVLIIEGDKTRMGVNNDLLDNARSIRRILCPAENAFDRYDEIYHEALKADKSLLVLIALGPTATVLSYDLYQAGFRALDVGHLDIEYEWFLRNVTKKIAIPDKYVNEAGYTHVPAIEDQKYLEEIVAVISNR